MDPIGKYSTIDEYIALCPQEIQSILRDLRAVIKAAAPAAVEKISYQMPAFDLNGILVYFAVHKNHIGFYPTPGGIEAFKGELSSYEMSKGAVQFPLGKPIPYELVSRMVSYRVSENLSKVKSRKK